KNLLARKVLKLPNNFRQAPIGHVHFILFPALPAETEFQFCCCYIHMTVSHRREAKRFVFLGVFLVADANECALEKLHHRREHFLARQSAPFQVAAYAPAYFWESFAEDQDAIVLV